MRIVQEFKNFAIRGNVVDMAIGIVIGGAFGKIATSLVNDVIMPPVGLLVGGIDFSQKMVVLKKATEAAPAIVLKYGAFINTVVDFTVVAAAMFMVIKGMNALRVNQESRMYLSTPTEKLLAEIRDLLKKQ